MLKRTCITSLLVAVLSGCNFGPHSCDTPTLNTLARAYTLSVDPFAPKAFKNFVTQSPEAFAANGRVMQCAKAYSAAIAQRGMGSAGANQAMTDSVDRQMQLLGGSASPAQVSQGGRMLLAAQELGWLVEIMPSAADGDFRQFDRGNPWRAEVDQLATQASQMAKLMGMEGITNQMRIQQQAANEQYFVQLGQQMFGS